MLQRIAAHPEYFGFIFDNFRDAALKKFPYLIIFKIEGKRIYINSVRHTRRKPKF
jgi:toxin ParE1/3/4